MDNLINLAGPEAMKTPDELLGIMIKAYEEEYYKQTGQQKTLKPADSARIELISTLPMFYQLYELISYNSRMNYLKWAEGGYLDELGALLNVKRLAPQKAVTTVRFVLSEAAQEAAVIPAGTRVSSGGDLFFQTIAPQVIDIGAQRVDVTVEALTAGLIGNRFAIGQLNTLVDPLPYVASVENIEPTQGGADREDDERFRQRIELKPDSFSVAGPAAAYSYFAKSYSQVISDVAVDSPTPGVVDMRIILNDGQLPTDAFLQGLKDSMTDQRPLTDHLIVAAPEVREFTIALTFYLDNSCQNEAETIKAAIQLGLAEYTASLSRQIGKDIIPDEIIKICLDNGAKRLIIAEPSYTVITSSQTAKCTAIHAEFGGFETR